MPATKLPAQIHCCKQVFITIRLQPDGAAVCCGMDNLENSNPPGREPDGARTRLAGLREALLHLHKTLLDAERASYEAAFGQIASPYQFLHLLTNDPWFAWLAPVTQLLAGMDAALDAREPLTAAGVEELARRMKTLLVPSETGNGFPHHYHEALQRSPDVLYAHATAARLLRAKP